jgi:hypothetical protein
MTPVIPRSAVAAENARIVLEYREAFSTFEPERYEPYLAEHPAYHAGMNHKMGRMAFHHNAGAGRVLYPHGALRQEDLRVIADGDWVAVPSPSRARRNSPPLPDTRSRERVRCVCSVKVVMIDTRQAVQGSTNQSGCVAGRAARGATS